MVILIGSQAIFNRFFPLPEKPAQKVGNGSVAEKQDGDAAADKRTTAESEPVGPKKSGAKPTGEGSEKSTELGPETKSAADQAPSKQRLDAGDVALVPLLL